MPVLSYTMNIVSVTATQSTLWFIVHDFTKPQLLSLVKSHHNVYLDTSINEK